MSDSLSESGFWILTSLLSGRKHGYAIMQRIVECSSGSYSPKVTTLYAALERMAHNGEISVDGEEIVEGRARRYFTITEQGREALNAEIQRMEGRMNAARAALRSPLTSISKTGVARA